MMRTKRWLLALVALIVAAMMLLADLSFAQPRGQGMGRRAQDGQVWAPGQGGGNSNCPYYPGYGKRSQPQGSQVRARQGRGWNQPVNPPGPQSVIPPAAQ